MENLEIIRFGNTYKNKKVFVTGHTGFKGSWLTTWLLSLGAEVAGFSNKLPSTPSMFEDLILEDKIKHFWGDINDYSNLKKCVDEFQPDYIFHLAAQAIVSQSYKDPLETLSTNIIGTANILNILRTIPQKCILVQITSDKCYENVEWEWGYRESDRLGGKDIYSSSKACAELVAHSFYHSFLEKEENKLFATARAGNVIGGGDWAADRIIPDCIRAWNDNNKVTIRSPKATRPWQHVLEPLSGYLRLGQMLNDNPRLKGHSFNFGPESNMNVTVAKLISDLGSYWGFDEQEQAFNIQKVENMKEAGLLKLSCDKSLFHLNWTPTLNYKELISFTGKWYKSFTERNTDLFNITSKQIEEYEKLALSKSQKWIQAISKESL